MISSDVKELGWSEERYKIPLGYTKDKRDNIQK